MHKKENILLLGQDFGSRLRFLRKNKGLSQVALAKKLGYKAGASVSKMEANVTPPDLLALAKIAEVLGVDLHWLITGEASPAEKKLSEKLYEVLSRFAPYVGDEITRLFEKKAELTAKRKALSVRRLEDEEGQAVRLELLGKDIAKVQEYIKQTVEDLDYIQHPLGDGSSAQKTTEELEST